MRFLLFLFVCACGALPDAPPEQDCESRVIGYPDVDRDGLGENSSVYIGCELPKGYVGNANDTAIDTAT